MPKRPGSNRSSRPPLFGQAFGFEDVPPEQLLPAVVVQRALIGNFFAPLLERWMRHRAEILRLEWKVDRSAIPGDTLTFSGVVRCTDTQQGATLPVDNRCLGIDLAWVYPVYRAHTLSKEMVSLIRIRYRHHCEASF